MFKRGFQVSGSSLLSKKDLKALKGQLEEQYPSLDEVTLKKLIPTDSVKSYRLDNRCIIYAHEKEKGSEMCIFFDAEGRGEIFPTLVTLWKFPFIMPELTIHPPVSQFVLRGADLMLPGVIVPVNGVAGFGTVAKGQKRCIKIEGNPYPIAVGKVLVNQSQFEKLKGKGLEVCHVFKDALWVHMYSPIPNSGFTEKEEEVTPCMDMVADGEFTAATSATAVATGGAGAEAEDVEAEGAAARGEGPEGGGGEKIREAASGAEGSPEAAASVSPGDVSAIDFSSWSQDDLLELCFICAVKAEPALPVEAGEFLAKHIMMKRPEGTTLDVKKSSHKQIGKFLNAMRKAKVIDVTDKKNVITVVKIDLGSRNFKLMEEKYAAAVEFLSGAESGEGAEAAGAAAAAGEPPRPPIVTTVWKPTHYLGGLWKAMEKNKDGMYLWEGAMGILTGYVKKEELAEGDTVKLDEMLIDSLYKVGGAQKAGATFPETVELEELEGKLEERMQEHTTIEMASGAACTRKGPMQRIEVTLSRKGAHNVTRICNLEAYGIDVETMANELKKKMSCTAHIEDMPGKNAKDKMLQLQGHVADDLKTYLLNNHGITPDFMSVK